MTQTVKNLGSLVQSAIDKTLVGDKLKQAIKEANAVNFSVDGQSISHKETPLGKMLDSNGRSQVLKLLAKKPEIATNDELMKVFKMSSLSIARFVDILTTFHDSLGIKLSQDADANSSLELKTEDGYQIENNFFRIGHVTKILDPEKQVLYIHHGDTEDLGTLETTVYQLSPDKEVVSDEDGIRYGFPVSTHPELEHIMTIPKDEIAALFLGE